MSGTKNTKSIITAYTIANYARLKRQRSTRYGSGLFSVEKMPRPFRAGLRRKWIARSITAEAAPETAGGGGLVSSSPPRGYGGFGAGRCCYRSVVPRRKGSTRNSHRSSPRNWQATSSHATSTPRSLDMKPANMPRL
jgi:hypothetical protein